MKSRSRRHRRIAAFLLYTFGIDAAAAMPATASQPLVVAAALSSSGSGHSSSPPSACDQALATNQSPTSSVSVDRLWPASGSMQPVGYQASLGSACANVASLRVAVYSDESDQHQDDHHQNDRDAAIDTQGRLVLRSERESNRDGRVYLIVSRATSVSGATNTSCRAVGVPKSQDRRDLDSLSAQISSALAYCNGHDAAPSSFCRVLDTPWGGPSNQRPLVNAGPNLTVSPGDSVSLQGTVTDDGLPGSPLGKQWSAVSGPGTVTFQNANQAATTATFSKAGTYVLRLTGNDGALQASDDTTITVVPRNNAPVVNAGPDKTIAYGASATLQGSVTDDGLPNGTLTKKWTVVSGPGTVTFQNANQVSTSATFSKSGTYVLKLAGNDGALQATDQMTVIVGAQNRAPIVSAGLDRSGQVGATVLLQGTVTDDGLPNGMLTKRWSVVSGPGTVVFQNANQASTTATFSRTGTYTLRLTGNDGVLQASDDVRVSIGAQNLPPVVNAGPDRTITLPINSVTLVGSATDDDCPSHNLHFNWSVVSGPGTVVFGSPTSATTTATFSQAGTYVLRLTVSDGLMTGYDDVQVAMNSSANLAPVVSAGPDRAITLPTNTALLQGTLSDDGRPSGVLTSAWAQISGPAPAVFASPTTTTTNVTVTAAGTYVFRLTGSDGALTAFDEMTLIVSPPVNLAPVVDAGPDVEIQLPGLSTTLIGSASDDGLPSSNLSVAWTQISGPGVVAFGNPALASTSVHATIAGTYRLRLTATDGVLSASDDTTLIVLPEPLPAVSIDDLSVLEGNNGRHTVELVARLSRPSTSEVRVDFVSTPGTASLGCDYEAAFGTLIFAPGVTELPVSVFVNGEVLVENAETVDLHLGNPVGAVVAQSSAMLTLLNDDAPNAPPSRPTDRTPEQGARELPLATPLAWSASAEPDGDAVSYEVQLASAFSMSGQRWTASCAAGTEPPARTGAASAYVDGSDRLLVFGGSTGSSDLGDLWVLRNATGAGRPAEWQELVLAGGPGPRRQARSVYDSVTDRLIVLGGCTGTCVAPSSEVWALVDATTDTPSWLLLSALPLGLSTPAVAIDDASGRVYVFGGSSSSGLTNGTLRLDSRAPASVWTLLTPGGVAPTVRDDATSLYDAVSDRLLVHGGRTSTGASASLFVLEAASTASSAWAEVAPVGGAPVARYGHALHYDSFTDRAVLFGGTTAGIQTGTNFVASDTWVLSGVRSSTPSWTKIETANSPVGRFDAASGYSPSENRLVTAFGSNNKIATPVLSDVEVLEDAIGRIETISQSQATTSLVPSTVLDETYYWRVIAHDANGASAGSRAMVFSSGLPSLRLEGSIIAEGNTFAGLLSFRITMSRPSSDEVSVDFSTQSGTAASGSDFVPVVSHVVFAPGQTAREVQVATIPDLTPEGEETMQGSLNNPVGASISQGSAAGVILNDDVPNAPPQVNAGPEQTRSWTPLPRQGRLVVNWDEWTLSDSAFTPATAIYAKNIARWFSPNRPGKFLALSGNFGLVGTNLAAAIRADGHTWTVNSAPSMSLAFLSQFDGIFLTTDRVYEPLVLAYLNQGGNVYVGAGTGVGGEADRWNPLLAPFGLAMEVPYSGTTTYPSASTHPVLLGVSGIYGLGGNAVRLTGAPDPRSQILLSFGTSGLIAVFDGQQPGFGSITVPLAGSASDDGRPVPPALSVLWTQVSGPAPATIATPGVVATTVLIQRLGTYVFRLTASDGALSSSSDVSVTVVENLPPVTNAGADQLIELPVSSTSLTGTATDDGQPGGPLTYSWSQLAGPGVATFTPPASPTPTVSFSVAGPYVLRLTVSDGASSSFDDVQITLRDPLNLPPSVTVAPPGTATSRTVPLVATVVDDGRPIGGAISASWSIESLPFASIVSIADPGALSTTATVTLDGPYVFRVNVSDGELSTTTLLSVDVDGRNRAPVVNAGPDQAITTSQAVLSSTFTDDGQPVGGTPSTNWVQISGPALATIATPASPSTSVTLPAAGSYVFQVEVSDGELVGTDTITINASQPNDPPSVSAGSDQSVAAAVATLSGAYSDDGRPFGGTVTVLWSQVSGPSAALILSPANATTSVQLPTDGEYVFRLDVDDSLLSSFDEVIVTRLPGGANLPPSVNAGADQSIGGLSSILTATYVDDGLPLGGAVQYLWSQTSGPSVAVIGAPTQLSTPVQFTTSGTFGFRLQATDGELVAMDTVNVTVTIVVDPPTPLNNPPSVSAGPDQSLLLPTLTTSLQGTVADDGFPAPPSLSSQWSQRAGPTGVVFQNATAPTSGVTFPAPGGYVLRLTATDGQATSFDEMVVNIAPAPPSGAAPQVIVTSPADGAAISAPVNFVGSIISTQLLDWRLEVKEKAETTFRTVSSGNTPVANGIITTFDPSILLNGLYDIRLVARDTALRTTTLTQTAVVKDALKVGQFSVSFTDLDVPLAGLPIRVTRTYDSRDKAKGDFGFGWRLDLSNVQLRENGVAGDSFAGTVSAGIFPSYCLQRVRPHIVTITLPGGDVLEFEPVIAPSCQSFAPIAVATVSYVPRAGSRTLGTLRPAGGGSVVVSGTNGPVQLFDETTYDIFNPDEYILTMPDGRELTINQTSGLKRIKDLNGNTLDVTSAGISHSSGRGVTFVRDGQGRITTVTDPQGRAQTYEYDSAGDLVVHTDRENNSATFAYLASPAHHLESIVDPLGRTPIRNEYYPDGRIQRHTDAYGKTIEYAHDVTGRQEVVTDREGAVRVLHFDNVGNVIKEVQPDGRQILRTFDARNNRTSETEAHDPSNLTPAKTSWTFDATDNLLSTTDALGNTTSQTYNARRQVLTATDAGGKTTTNVYDVKGNLTQVTDGAGQVTTFTYDASGNLLTQSQTVGGVTETTTNTYDSFGNALTTTDALGRVTTQSYDASGNRTNETRTRTLPGGGTETLVTTFAYDRNNRLLKTTDPDGTFTESVYDASGRQVSTKDKLGRVTSFSYDLMGRLTRTTYADTTFDESTYDAEGRRLTSRDRGGRTTTNAYDSLGRLTRTTYADASFTESIYDAAGHLTSSKDARGKSTTYEYDVAGRRAKTIDPLGHATVFTYDANGNQATVKDADNRTTTYEYDDLNRRTKTIFADASFTQTAYDEAGRRTSERDQAGKVTQFRYDKLGRLVEVIDALNQETTYTYDELGNRLTQTDANLRTTKFEYDRLGRETARVLPDNARETKTYDVTGNLATRADFLGRLTNYGYDINGRLISRTATCSSCDKADATWTYTATGRKATATYVLGAASTTEVYGYDDRDRLTSKSMPSGGLTYTYDANSNRATMTSTVGATASTATYAYDDAGRLDTVTDSLGRLYDLGYDNVGNRTSLTQPNGVATTYTYNSLNRLTNLTTLKGATTIQSYAFTLGPTGNRTQIVEADKTKTYTYDDLYRLIGEQVSGGTTYSKTFGYDAVGNRQTQTTTGTAGVIVTPGTVNYGYDTRDRLLTENSTTYGYDANGNLTTQSGFGTYTFDTENRLVRVAKTDGTLVEHSYDADGTRIRTRTTPPSSTAQTTNFLVDTSGGLSHVVADVDVSRAQAAYYLRALDDLVAVIRPAGTRYFHADGIGSIRKLTNETGAVTDTYEYTAFGEQYEHVGADAQSYSFAGEPLDPNTGFQYHRARWMYASTGRFLAMDPYPGDTFGPDSLHRYLYVSSEPVLRTDPTGLITSALIAAAVGTEVHARIGADFAAQRGAGVFTNYFPIFTVVNVPRATCKPLAAFCDRRPDLADARDNPFPEVYEIKPQGLYGEGFWAGYADVLYNSFHLLLNDPNGRLWHPGMTYLPPSTLVIQKYGTWFIQVSPPIDGVILYSGINAEAAKLAVLVSVGVMAGAQVGSMMTASFGPRLALSFGF